MAFFTLDQFATKIVRSPGVDPVVNPQPIDKGTIVIASDSKAITLALTAGHLGGDNFEVQFTAGSNLVIIPNNVLNITGLKLFSPQFPAGVAITSKTANYREYTIATAATVTRKEFANFHYNRTLELNDFSRYNYRTSPYTDLNGYINEGSYFVSSSVTNIPIAGSGFFVDVAQQGASIIQTAKQNGSEMRTFQRRSSNSGSTWTAWAEYLTSNLTWVAATLQNGCTNVTGRPVQYAMSGNMLFVRGGVNTPSGALPADATIFIVPTAYYPAQEVFTAIYGAGTGATSFPVNRASLKTTGAFVNSFAVTVNILQVDCVLTLK